MADDCERHRGPMSHTDPALDRIMDSLPENQSGKGRHKCPYCAYERGVAKGRQIERSHIAKWLDVPVDELLDRSS